MTTETHIDGPAKTGRIRIIVVDDHPVVREGLVAMLQTQADFEVVGEAASGAEGLTLIEQLSPAVVLLDLELPGIDGVGVLKQLRERRVSSRVIVFTVFDTDERIIAAVEAGAAGYLLKGAPRSELFAAIRIADRGGSLLQPLVASTVLRHVARRDRDDAAPSIALTPREHEVLGLLAHGKGNKEIAATLGVTERTVKFHVSAIFTKLGVTNRTEAVTRAVYTGLVKL
jgi:DNA-binding NarL/FixJ family response regulator